MTVLTFPSNPIEGQQYAAPNGIQYVFDGVKWIVETTSSSSSAVTNSTQDRVAPMFVDGTHSGITFAYNAETNVMSAEVTAVNGNRLINGEKEVVLGADGTVTFPSGTIQAESDINLKITSENYLILNSGQFSQIEIGRYQEGGVVVLGGTNTITEVDGALQVNGNISYAGDITQSSQDQTICLTGVNTVVYTSTAQFQHAIKLFVMVEGIEDGGTVWETQACDIIAVRGFTDNVVHVTAYGVTYSSGTPLATFDGRWNATSSRIEITCTPVSATNEVVASVHAIEMTSND